MVVVMKGVPDDPKGLCPQIVLVRLEVIEPLPLNPGEHITIVDHAEAAGPQQGIGAFPVLQLVLVVHVGRELHLLAPKCGGCHFFVPPIITIGKEEGITKGRVTLVQAGDSPVPGTIIIAPLPPQSHSDGPLSQGVVLDRHPNAAVTGEVVSPWV